MEIETPKSHFGLFDILPLHLHTNKISQITRQESALTVRVSLAPATHPTHALILTESDIILKAIQNATNQTSEEELFCSIEITFELKFQVIFLLPDNPKSTKIGIRLSKEGQTCNIYCPDPSSLSRLYAGLNKKLNQGGFHHQFKPVRKIGKGNFASVYEVLRIEDGERMAVKAFSKANSFSSENGKQSLINELDIMRTVSHKCPNLMSLESVFESDNSIYVVLELLKGKTLYELIKQKNGIFTRDEVREIMFGLLKGLRCLEKHNIMHRDLKPQNIIIRGRSDPVIVDFGLATHCDRAPYLFYRCGTPGFVAPEIVRLTQNTRYDSVCDMFSLGCIFHVLMTNYAIFPGTTYDEVYRKNKNLEFQIREAVINNFNAGALNLLRNMIYENPLVRIKASAALKHQFFSNGKTVMEEDTNSEREV